MKPNITKQECTVTLECSYQTVYRYQSEREASKPKKVNHKATAIVKTLRQENTKARHREYTYSTRPSYNTVYKYRNN